MMNKLSIRSHLLFIALRNIRHGRFEITFPDQTKEIYGNGNDRVCIKFLTWEAINQIAKKNDIGLADAIIDGKVIIDNLPLFIELICRNNDEIAKLWQSSLHRLLSHGFWRFIFRNNRKKAKKNIQAHSDLSNEFFSFWLDDTMSYSSGIFTKPEDDLTSAQLAKYETIIDKLKLKAEDTLLEIGCGWGGLFTYIVKKIGCKVVAVTNSDQQYAYNKKQIADLNLSDKVSLLKKDYRDITGCYSKIVSIEMIEAVGEKYWPIYFQQIANLLQSGGLALIQAITIREDLFQAYRVSTDFIQKYIFPGGMLLTEKTFYEQKHVNGLNVVDYYLFMLSYAQTLSCWRKNFHQHANQIKALNFDERFMRLWDFYLAYCEGGFRAGHINVGQFLLTK
jgi:cyclopropane-fatty-acyl-phospholipid synthase